jgi:hypothetical protein
MSSYTPYCVSPTIFPLHVKCIDVSPAYEQLHAILRESNYFPASRQVKVDVSPAYEQLHAILRESNYFPASRQVRVDVSPTCEQLHAIDYSPIPPTKPPKGHFTIIKTHRQSKKK